MLFTAWRILSLHPPSSKFDKLLSTSILVSSQSSAVAQCKFSAVAVCKFTFNCFTTSSLSLSLSLQLCSKKFPLVIRCLPLHLLLPLQPFFDH